MLVVQVNALRGVNVLNVLNEGVHRRLDIGEFAQVAEVHEALGDLVTSANGAAVLDTRHEAHGCRNTALVKNTRVIVAVGDGNHVLRLLRLDGHETGVRSQIGLATQNLLVDVANNIEHTANRRQTLCNVVDACNAAGVNGTHRKLCTRLANGLSSDNANCGTNGNRTAGRKIPAIALLADAVLRAAGQQSTQLNLLEASVDHLLQVIHAGDVGVALKEHGALGVHNVLCDAATYEVGVDVVGTRDNEVVAHALGSAAVVLAHDDVLSNVDQTTGKVTRVRRVRSGVDQALTSAIGRDEVLKWQQTLAEVSLNGKVDRLTRHVGHQTTHTAELTQLRLRTTGAGVGHHVDRILLIEEAEHLSSNFVGSCSPLVNNLGVALLLVNKAFLEILVNLVNACLSLGKDLRLLLRDQSVPQRDGQTSASCKVEASELDGVKNRGNLCLRIAIAAVCHELSHIALDHLVVHVLVVCRQALTVEDDTTDGGLEAHGLRTGYVVVHRLVLAVHHAENLGAVLQLNVSVGSRDTHLNLGLKVNLGTSIVSSQSIVKVGKHVALARHTIASERQIVHTNDHVLRRNVDGLARSWRAQVVGREHKHASLGLGLERQRHMYRHLVAVEVGVEGRAYQRMQVDGLALDKDRLEGLNGEAVQGRGAVQQHETAVDNLFQDVPHKGSATLDGTLSTLDVVNLAQLNQTLHNEGLKELESHGLRQTTLVKQKLGVGNNNRTARVVNTLTQQVLTEATLLTLQRVRERLQRTVALALHC